MRFFCTSLNSASGHMGVRKTGSICSVLNQKMINQLISLAFFSTFTLLLFIILSFLFKMAYWFLCLHSPETAPISFSVLLV